MDGDTLKYTAANTLDTKEEIKNIFNTREFYIKQTGGMASSFENGYNRLLCLTMCKGIEKL